jgi:hypothetical protein
VYVNRLPMCRPPFTYRLIIMRFVLWFSCMVFYATFNNISVISWWLVLFVEENGENH